jgi:hypothetical protein
MNAAKLFKSPSVETMGFAPLNPSYVRTSLYALSRSVSSRSGNTRPNQTAWCA